MNPRVVRALPNVQPILLAPRRDPFDDAAWLFEPKYDGFRGLLYVTWYKIKNQAYSQMEGRRELFHGPR